MSIEVQENVVLAPHTIYRVGGLSRFFVEVKYQEELRAAVEFAAGKGVPFFLLGAGSNVLISDNGYEGVVIKLTGGEAKVDGERLMVDAGVMVAQAVLKSAQAGLTGFEWGIGVPGTIGGSVRGNAGCFGYEMKDVVESVSFLQIVESGSRVVGISGDLRFAICDLQNSQCEFGYRDSVFKIHPDWIILSATLRLKKGDSEEVREKIRQITAERTQKQDIGSKSCGCIFKNVAWSRKDIDKRKLLERFPEFAQFRDRPNIPASFLIDLAGLKGRRVGGVFISPKHANFFVNAGEASAEEVILLIAIAKDLVRRKFGVLLEEEIQYVGF